MKFTRRAAWAVVYWGENAAMSRRGDNQQRRWSAWGWGLLVLLATLSFSACISDVVIPECLKDGSCGGAGGDGEGPSAGANAGGSLVDSAGQGIGGTGAEAAAAGQGGEAGEPDTCTSCRVLPEHLAPACAGKPYQAIFDVKGGLPPYSWRLSPQPTGWTIAGIGGDSESAVLRSSGAPDEAMELTLVVTDARTTHLSMKLALDVRTSCWFAYSTLQADVPELRLVDPLAEVATPTPLEHEQGAYDFQFSPNGAFLVYRYGVDGDHPRGRHLSLVDLASLKEHEVGFAEDQVLSYAWDPSSSVLAAAFEKDGKSYLGAARPPALGSDDSPTSLTSVEASVDSDLHWVDGDYVVFHTPSGLGEQRSVYYSAFTGSGFDAPLKDIQGFDPGITVQPNETGFFLITPFQTFYDDLSDGGYVQVPHPDITLVSPSGHFTGLLAPNGLPQVLPAATADFAEIAEPTDETQNCVHLLAWATDRERIACVADVSNGDGTSHGEVRLFDLDADPLRLNATTLKGYCPGSLDDTGSESCLAKREGYSYGSSQALGSARSFSRSGRYFAFARELGGFTYVYWADLDVAPAQIAEPVALGIFGTGPLPLGFAFSPDERFLAVRRGPWLSLIELETRAQGFLTGKLEPADACSEDFLAGPQAYCGNREHPGVAAWAPDSRRVAFRTTEGLTISDLSQFPTKDVKVLPAAECAGQCSGQFGFQP